MLDFSDFKRTGIYILTSVADFCCYVCMSLFPGDRALYPWALAPRDLGGKFKLGEDYPTPLVKPQEWARHYGKGQNKKSAPKRQGRPQKGIDFYFKSSGSNQK